MSGFWGGMRGLKVKELQPYVLKQAKEHWDLAKLVKNSKDFIHEYKVKHIDTGSAKPLFHTMAIVFFGSYALAYPHVRTLPAKHQEWCFARHRAVGGEVGAEACVRWKIASPLVSCGA